MKALQSVLEVILIFLELFFFFRFRDSIIQSCSFFSNSSSNAFEDIYINILASIIFSGLQFCNLFVIRFILINLKKTYIALMKRLFKFSNTDIEECLKKLVHFLFSFNKKWGTTLHANVLKNANTAEALIAFADIINKGVRLPETQIKEIKQTLNRLLSELKEQGYLSVTQKVYSVHCTGMILYVIKRYIDLDIYCISDEDEDRIRDCLKQLLKNANQKGWGFINQKYTNTSYNRSFSTIWALRALNIWGLSENKIVREISINLCDTNGIIGFSPDGSKQCSVTALLCLYISELKEGNTKRKVFEIINKKQIYRFLIKGLKNETESENFFLSIEDHNTLSWTHLSWCLIIQVLAADFYSFRFVDIFKISISIKRNLNKIDDNLHYYKTETMNCNFNDPFSYPTTYLISALSGLLNK